MRIETAQNNAIPIQEQRIKVNLVTSKEWADLEVLMKENHCSESYMRHTIHDHILHQAEINTSSRIIHDDENGENALLLIAYLGEQPAGYLLAECIGTWRQPHVVSFHMFVSTKFRGIHVGTLIFEEFLEWCQRHPKILKIELLVMEENINARALYEKHGFEVEGNRKKTAFKDGKFHDLILMGKVLNKDINYSLFQPIGG